MLNCIAIHGRLTADPELKTTQSGVPSCRFTVAVDRSYSKGEKMTDFFSVVCWRGLAETVSKYFHKGKEIVVRGEMQSHKWTDKDGVNRVSWEIMADSVDFCGSKSFLITFKGCKINRKSATVSVFYHFVPFDFLDFAIDSGNHERKLFKTALFQKNAPLQKLFFEKMLTYQLFCQRLYNIFVANTIN
jgi:single-strand DNA-binding protein